MKFILYTALLLCMFSLSFAESPYISVSGESEEQLEPQYAKISGQIKTVHPSMEKSHSRLIKRIKLLNKHLLDAGISGNDLEKSNVRQGVTHEWKKKERIVTGYFSSVQVDITVSNLNDLQKVYKALSKLQEFSITNTQYRRFDLEEQQIKQAEKALKKAKTKAFRMARTLGASLGSPQRISETGTHRPRPMVKSMSALHADVGAHQEDFSGYLIVRSVVQVDFLLK
ncbi:MAG: SIMPL domain-containing protein [Fibrobacterales bacterium]